MKLHSARNLLIIAALVGNLGACASQSANVKSSENVARGPLGPPSNETIAAEQSDPDSLEPTLVEAKIEKAGPEKPILKDDLDGDKNVLPPVEKEKVTDPQRTLKNPDPLMSGVARGEDFAEGGTDSGIASGGKGARGATGAPFPSDGAGSGSTAGGSRVGAASEVRATIDRAEVQRVVKAHVGDVKRCYEAGLARRPDLEGKVTVKFTIGKTGTVIAASVLETSLNDRQTEQCIVASALKWVFPKPTGEGLVTLSYPFLLKSAN
jgi:TonB family protein